MGCGKTSIGRRLAKRLGLPFYDSDHELEESAGCPIKAIEDVYGEEALMRGEYKVIKRLLEQDVHVLATGGSSLKNPDTLKLVQDVGITVWLKADLETLVSRVSRRSDRPLISKGKEREVLEDIIKNYYPIYEKAHIHVDTFDEPTNLTVDRVIKNVSDYVQEHYPDQCVLKTI
ncbi:MAG: shikimate kinase [Alphaproteobacteria bacterium]|nr:MAG: shikimate kinase [Alphaproteobacteria bacterium]